MTRLLLLAAALGVAGCSLIDDCRFETEERRYENVLQADAPALGDTLTLAVVDTGRPSLRAFVPAGLALARPSSDGTVRIGYDAEAFVFADSRALRLSAATRGDTVYVYVEGALDPSLFAQACSPPEERLRVDLSYVSAPPGVRALRVTRVGPEDLPPGAAQMLRQRDAARPVRPLTA